MSAARRALPLLAAVALIGLGWLGFSWFRESSLVQVRHVKVTGLTSATPDGPEIRRKLTSAAKEMTTLDVRSGGLERAVSAYPIVHSISASAHFPTTLEVQVHEYEPVATLAPPGGKGVVVSYDGTLLARVTKMTLPTVAVQSAPSSNGFESSRVKALVEVLAGAPGPLRAQLAQAYLGKGGIKVAMRDGPTLEFGTPSRVAAKWAAAARVLAARSSSGASAIDVRLPDRPAASGFGEDAARADAASSNPQL